MAAVLADLSCSCISNAFYENTILHKIFNKFLILIYSLLVRLPQSQKNTCTDYLGTKTYMYEE